MNDELQLKQIFVKNIDEKIDGVVKASDDGKIADEVREYVLTNEIQTNLEQFLDTSTIRQRITPTAYGSPASSDPVNRTC